MGISELIHKYKYLKSQLTDNLGCEESTDEVMWNDGIKEAMEKLLVGVDKNIARKLRLGHI